jgi:hypothetical protein
VSQMPNAPTIWQAPPLEPSPLLNSLSIYPEALSFVPANERRINQLHRLGDGSYQVVEFVPSYPEAVTRIGVSAAQAKQWLTRNHQELPDDLKTA